MIPLRTRTTIHQHAARRKAMAAKGSKTKPANTNGSRPTANSVSQDRPPRIKTDPDGGSCTDVRETVKDQRKQSLRSLDSHQKSRNPSTGKTSSTATPSRGGRTAAADLPQTQQTRALAPTNRLHNNNSHHQQATHRQQPRTTWRAEMTTRATTIPRKKCRRAMPTHIAPAPTSKSTEQPRRQARRRTTPPATQPHKASAQTHTATRQPRKPRQQAVPHAPTTQPTPSQQRHPTRCHHGKPS